MKEGERRDSVMNKSERARGCLFVGAEGHGEMAGLILVQWHII